MSHATTTWLVGLAWDKEAADFDGECLFIPAADIPKVAGGSGQFLRIAFRPSRRHRTRLDPYRRRLKELDRLVLEACGAGDHEI